MFTYLGFVESVLLRTLVDGWTVRACEYVVRWRAKSDAMNYASESAGVTRTHTSHIFQFLKPHSQKKPVLSLHWFLKASLPK